MQKCMQQIFFHIIPEKKGVDLYAGLEFFLHIGVKIWGGRLIRAVDLYASIYGNSFLACRLNVQAGSNKSNNNKLALLC